MEKGSALHLKKPEASSHKDALCKVRLKNGPVVLEKIFKFRQGIFAIPFLSPLGKGSGPLLKKLESPSP